MQEISYLHIYPVILSETSSVVGCHVHKASFKAEYHHVSSAPSTRAPAVSSNVARQCVWPFYSHANSIKTFWKTSQRVKTPEFSS